MQEKMNAVIYARYSSHNQTEQSIEGQLRDNYAFSERNGYTVVGEYIDRAKSATSDNREDFQRMIADAAKGQFQFIIVWKLDRFARNRYDSAIYKARLKKHGVRVISAMEAISDSPEGIMMEGMLESLAEYYSANLSENIKRGMRETTMKGIYPGGKIPYGYRLQDRKLVRNDRTAPIVAFIFEEYAKGVGKKEIFRKLTEKGVRSPSGKPLSMSSFQRMFKNPVYYGSYTHNGITVEGCAEPIITKDLFDQVQIRLAAEASSPASRKARVSYALHGKVFCGECGHPLVGEYGMGKCGVEYRYYVCSARKKASASCGKQRERKEDLEDFVVEETVQHVMTEENQRIIARQIVTEYRKEFSHSRIAELERAAEKLENDLNNLVDTLAECPPSARRRILERMETLELQKSDLEADVAKMRIASGIDYSEKDVLRWIRKFCTPPSHDANGIPYVSVSASMHDPDFVQRMIDTFINSVYVYNDKVIIFYNIRTTPDPHAPKFDFHPESFKNFTSTTSSLSSTTVYPPPSESSHLNAYAPPDNFKFEHNFLFLKGVFGCVIARGKMK